MSNTTKRTLFFIMVVHPVRGLLRVGKPYASREAASSWLSFVRKSWRVCRVYVAQCTVTWRDGKLCQRSAQMLDRKFNMDASSVSV